MLTAGSQRFYSGRSDESSPNSEAGKQGEVPREVGLARLSLVQLLFDVKEVIYLELCGSPD